MDKNKSFKTSIGGQALIEGVMMRSQTRTCLSVRGKDGVITSECFDTKPSKVAKIPIVRGVVAMVENMAAGVKYINRSADIAYGEEAQTDFDRKIKEKYGDKAFDFASGIGVVLGVVLAFGLFAFLPTFLTGLLDKSAALGGFKTVIEGVLKIAIFVLYLFLVTRMKEIHRVFEYHGAEHKSIACYESGMELTVENAKTCRRFHPRCGTSFIFIVLIISILLFSFIPWGSTIARVGLKLLLLPLVMGISYEIIKLTGRYDNALTRIVAAPGLWIQRLTTFEPDDSQLEVALTSLKAVMPQDKEECRW